MNLSGAEKITRYLGNYLSDEVGLKDRRGEEPLTTFWDEKRLAYEKDIQDQYLALENQGQQPAEQPSQTTQVTVSDTTASSTHKGYVFRYGSELFGIDEPASAIVATLGEPMSYYEAASCAFEGLDKIYTYANLVVETYPGENDIDLTSCISLRDDTLTTMEGAMIGDSKEKIHDIYGDPTQDETTKWTYEKDGMRLVFIFRDDKTALIEYRTMALDE